MDCKDAMRLLELCLVRAVRQLNISVIELCQRCACDKDLGQ